jgi:hypothetical protein
MVLRKEELLRRSSLKFVSYSHTTTKEERGGKKYTCGNGTINKDGFETFDDAGLNVEALSFLTEGVGVSVVFDPEEV